MDIINTIKAIILLDIDGHRTLAKIFDSTKINIHQFEKKLFIKTKKSKDEIISIDGFLIIHKFVADHHVYVVGNRKENPMILDSVSKCIVDVLTSLLSNKNSLENQALRDHLTQVILALDEICEDGLILETDSNLVLQRVLLKDDLVEQSYAQKLQSATEHIKFPWSLSR